MTLNIMLTSRSTAYLSGDFRITYCPEGRWTDDFNTQKLIPVIKLGWGALISFAGVAKLPFIGDLGNWVDHEMQDIRMNAAFAEVPRRLLSAANFLNVRRDRQPLTFSIVGFVGRRPVAMMISNFQDIQGRAFGSIGPELHVSFVKPKASEVRIAGDTKFVSRDDINELRSTLRKSADPRLVQRTLAEVNARAAAAEPASTISRECVTGYLLASGAAEVTPHGLDDSKAYIPYFVQRQLAAVNVRGLQLKSDSQGTALPAHWRGMTAKIDSKRKLVAVAHAFKNAEALIGDAPPKNSHVFWKIAGPDEPQHYKIQYSTKKQG